MNSLKATLVLTLLLVTGILQAQNSDYYKYQITEDKKGKQNDLGILEFWKSKDVLLSKKTVGKYSAPLKIFDLSKKVIIFDMAPRTEYIIEELDLLYKANATLTDAGRENVNGYMCKKYKAEVSLQFATGIYGLQTSQYDYEFIFWITEDISGTEDVNAYIASCMTTNMVRFDSKGVIVKMYCSSRGSSGTYTLVETGKKEKQYTLPWAASDRAVALISETSTHTGEGYTNYLKRIKALLTKITGIEKPKSATRTMGLNFM